MLNCFLEKFLPSMFKVVFDATIVHLDLHVSYELKLLSSQIEWCSEKTGHNACA